MFFDECRNRKSASKSHLVTDLSKRNFKLFYYQLDLAGGMRVVTNDDIPFVYEQKYMFC